MTFERKRISMGISVLLLLSLTLSILAPAVDAHSPPWDVPTYIYASMSPNPTGVNQNTLIAIWLNIVPPTANGAYGDRWQNITVTLTSPSGSTTTLGPLTSDPAGSTYTFFTPTEVGNYTVTAHFAGQILAGANPPPIPNSYSRSPYIGDYFQPSGSPSQTLVVQQQKIADWTPTPLPTGYWRRPIDAQNREWNVISGNWLGTGTNSRGSSWYNSSGNVAPYTTLPDSGHIVWTKPIAFGGQIGGQFGGSGVSAYYMGSAYEPFLRPPVIIQGRLYYNQPNPPRYGFYCVDLRTGKEVWYNNGTNAPATTYSAGSYTWPQITCGQVVNIINPNQYGGLPYLWYVGSPNYYMYDAFTGNYILTLTNASTGTIVMDQMGNMLVYMINSANRWLAMWNSTKAIDAAFNSTPAARNQVNYYWLWRPPTGTFNWRDGLEWNVTIPNVPGQSIRSIVPPIIWTRAVTSDPSVRDVGYSASDGSLLWGPFNRTGDEAYQMGSGTYSATVGGYAVGDGVFAALRQETLQWWGYDLATGIKLWGPSEPSSKNGWGVYSTAAYIAYGMLYEEAADGIHVFNITTGAKVWDFAEVPSGTETAYGLWPFEAGGMLIADGKVLAPVAHSHLQPLFRGARLYCLDAYTGKELWNVTGWYAMAGSNQGGLVAADGYIVSFNAYSNEIVTFGRGQSATIISAPELASPLGTPVLLKGTVTDQSPGETCLGIPAAGTPAISDTNMADWMAYLYMQQPKPSGATGVPVHLTAIDPNGNFQDIGTVNSDIDGTYATEWTPPVPGVYKVTAEFAGSNSYFSSSGTTYFNVGKAPAAAVTTPTPILTATPPTPSQTPSLTTSPSLSPTPTQAPPPGSSDFTTLYIAIAAVAITIAVVTAAVILRRRK